MIIKPLLHCISVHLIQNHLLTCAVILSAAVSWTALGKLPRNNGQNSQGQGEENSARYLFNSSPGKLVWQGGCRSSDWH